MTKYTVAKAFKGKDGTAWSVGQVYTGDAAEAKKQADAGNLKEEAPPAAPPAT